jgi:glycosyltransferase involved in cell wall biosynthesis
MRLLILTPEFPPHTGGGILKYYSLLADSLRELGTEVTVLVSSPFSSFDDYTTRTGIDVRFVPSADVAREAARLTHLAAAPMFRRFVAAALAGGRHAALNADRYDAIETTDFGLLFAPLLVASDRPNVLVTMHGSLGQISAREPIGRGGELTGTLSRVTESVLLPYADRLRAYSPSNASEWHQRLGADVRFVPPPLRLPSLVEPAASQFSGLVAARIQTWKGPELLCRALASLGPRLPADLKIAWAGRDTRTAPGGGSLSEWLAQEFPQIWGTHLVPVGQLPFPEVASLMRSVRYVIVPSLWDTFNYSLAEAMAAGCVTIASKHAGACFLIETGTNGFSFDPAGPEQLAMQVIEVHNATRERRQDMGMAARDTVARELDPLVVCQSWRDDLDDVKRKQGSTPLSPWIREFVDPVVQPDAPHDDALESVSIRALSSHIRRRLIRKITG